MKPAEVEQMLAIEAEESRRGWEAAQQALCDNGEHTPVEESDGGLHCSWCTAFLGWQR
jgi:hypothetical protein